MDRDFGEPQVEKTDLRHSFLTVKAEMSALQMRCERELPDAG